MSPCGSVAQARRTRRHDRAVVGQQGEVKAIPSYRVTTNDLPLPFARIIVA